MTAPTFDQANVDPSVRPWWWVAIQGLRIRYATREPSWNPADSGTNQHIDPLLARAPTIGQQLADPLNGSVNVSRHLVDLFDAEGAITALLAVSDTPAGKTFLTCGMTESQDFVPVDDYSDFASEGDLYLGTETIHYTGKAAGNTSRGADSLTGQTADADPSGASQIRIYDAARTEAADFWAGGEITFTSGSNSGQSRRIVRSVGSDPWGGSPFEFEDQGSTLYLDPTNPLPNNVTAGDAYTLKYSGQRIKDAGISGSGDDYWEGAKVTITGDTAFPENVGEVRYVKAFDDSADMLELHEPLPAPTGSGMSFTISRQRLTGCTRGLYGSKAQAHSVFDENGQVVPVDVVDQPPFIKGREVTIYEGRTRPTQEPDESEAKAWRGVIDTYSLDSSGMVYTFQVSGIMRLLAKKVIRTQRRGTLIHRDLWGGRLITSLSAYPSDSNDAWRAWPIMSDAEQADYAVTEFYMDSPATDWPASGNVKIGKELIHYRGYSGFIGSAVTSLVVGLCMRLADHFDFGDYQTAPARDQHKISPDMLGLPGRALFTHKIGPAALAKEVVDNWPATVPALVPEISALIEEHFIGDEIVQACICDDSPRSDFKKYDQIHSASYGGSLPSVPFTIEGANTGAQATVVAIEEVGSVPGCILTITDIVHQDEYSQIDGYFAGGERIDDTGSGFYAYVPDEGTRQGDGTELPARNNPINVLLQLLMSEQGDFSNGQYDSLPPGWGLGLTESEVDVDGLEQLRDRYFFATQIDFALHEPTSLKEWCEDHLFKFLQVFPYETTAGKISLASLLTEPQAQEADYNGEAVTLDTDHLSTRGLPAWSSGSPPVAKVVVNYGKHPVEDDYYHKLEVIFPRARRYYGEHGRTVVIDAAALYVPDVSVFRMEPGDPGLPDLVRRLVSPMWGRHSTHPAPQIEIEAPYSDMDLEIGTVAKLTCSGLPNLRTGARGLSDEYVQIMGKKPSAEAGFCRLTVWQVGVHDRRYGRKAPSASVYSYAADSPSAGKSTIVTYENNFSRNGEYDADHFKVGDVVQFLTNTYDPLSGATLLTGTIESIVGTTIVIDTVPATAPSQGDLMEVAIHDDASSVQRTRFVFCADEDRGLGATPSSAYKYR